MKLLSLVWANLKRKKLRTILTLLSIFIAFLLFGLLGALKEALTGGVNLAGVDRLIVRHKVSLIMTLPVSYGPRMQNLPGVDAAAHSTWFGGIYKDDPRNFFGSIPVEPEHFLDLYPEYQVSDEHKQAWLRTRTGAVVGQTLIQRFGWKIGDRVALKSPIWRRENDQAWEFDIVGVYTATQKNIDTSALFFRYDYFDEARIRGKGEVGWYVVRVKPVEPGPDADRRMEEKVAQVVSAIDAEFANSPHETKTEPEGAFVQGFVAQMGNIGMILIAVLSAVFFTILLVAGNTMAQAVRERTEEIGVLKALGFTNQRVMWLVLAESLVIAAVGGLAGLGTAFAITLAGSPMPSMLPVFFLPLRDLGIGAVLVVLLGIVAGILPAVQAMRLQVAAALRRQG